MTASHNLKDQLLAIVSRNNVLFDEELKLHTYIRLGGKADYFITPSSIEELERLERFCNSKSIPITVLGNGSKLIIQDGGIRGVVISLENLKRIQTDQETVTAQGGAGIMDVSEAACESGLSGLEFACGIPGTVGGTIYMNAGAYDGEIKDVLESCLILERSGKISRKTKAELQFSYRYSNLRETGAIVIEAVFRLQPKAKEEIRAKMDYFTEQRKQRQPLEYPSCGSVFKRPEGYFAGQLIQNCGLQGIQIGGAEVSEKHAGFIVNVNNATAKDYIELIEYIKKIVRERYQVDLALEVEIIGEP